MFRIRIDEISGLNVDEILEVCETTRHVVVRHELPHGNPHYHMFIETDVKENTLRLRFKRKYSTLKSSDYSIKKCDSERVNEYVQYMFNTKHGNRWELYDTYNFDNELLNTLKENAKNISDQFEASTTRVRSKGPTIWDIAMEVEAIVNPTLTVNDLGTTRIKQFNNEIDELRVYTDTAMLIMRKYRKPFDEFLLRKVISTAMSSSQRGKDIMRSKMINHFYSNK